MNRHRVLDRLPDANFQTFPDKVEGHSRSWQQAHMGSEMAIRCAYNDTSANDY